MIKNDNPFEIKVNNNMIERLKDKIPSILKHKELLKIYYIFSKKELSIHSKIGDSLYFGEYQYETYNNNKLLLKSFEKEISIIYEKLLVPSQDFRSFSIKDKNDQLENFSKYDYYYFYQNDNDNLLYYINKYIWLLFSEQNDYFLNYIVDDLILLMNSNLPDIAKQEIIKLNNESLNKKESINTTEYKNNMLFFYKRDPISYFNYLRESVKDSDQYDGVELNKLNNKVDIIETINAITTERIKNNFYRGIDLLMFYPYLNNDERQLCFGKQNFILNEQTHMFDEYLENLNYLNNNNVYIMNFNGIFESITKLIHEIINEEKQRKNLFSEYKNVEFSFESKQEISYAILSNIESIISIILYSKDHANKIYINESTKLNLLYNIRHIKFVVQLNMSDKYFDHNINIFTKEIEDIFSKNDFEIIEDNNYVPSIYHTYGMDSLY